MALVDCEAATLMHPRARAHAHVRAFDDVIAVRGCKGFLWDQGWNDGCSEQESKVSVTAPTPLIYPHTPQSTPVYYKRNKLADLHSSIGLGEVNFFFF